MDSHNYIGEMLNGKRHGLGAYIFKNGCIYVGEWRRNKMHGKGTFILKSGSKYTGEFVSGKRHGIGTFFFSDSSYFSGDRFIAEWYNGRIDGSVSYHKKSGKLIRALRPLETGQQPSYKIFQ